ncbi:hypothetical protein P3S68_015629 [Capsicum galapagoense]
MTEAYFNRTNELCEDQEEEIEESLRKGELEISNGLNQELGFVRASNTLWRSHYKSFNNFILMFDSIIDVLDTIAINAFLEEKCRLKEYLNKCLAFEVVFMLHFMRNALTIINDLNAAFEKKEQDIANAILLIGVTKDRLQLLRDEAWQELTHLDTRGVTR